MTSYALENVNQMPVADFVTVFGDVAEHSPWVAEKAAVLRPFLSKEAMHDAFSASVLQAPRDQQLALIRAHPDLAGKAAMHGDLTRDSASEQSGAGLDRLTKAEYDRFTELNERYREKFDFPFIFAIKGANKHQILEGFEARILNDQIQELSAALDNISRIFSFRIEERVT